MQRPTLSGRSPPKHRREAFGGVDLKSTTEIAYEVGKNNNSFLQRNVKIRSDTVNGLSFIHSIAKSIPIDKNNTLVAGNKKRDGEKNLDKIKEGFQAPVTAGYNSNINTDASSYRQLKNPLHGKRQIFLKDSFSNSNCASSQVSENGKNLAAKYYSNERPLGGMPALYKGESKFASTTYTGHKKPVL